MKHCNKVSFLIFSVKELGQGENTSLTHAVKKCAFESCVIHKDVQISEGTQTLYRRAL